MGGTTVSNWSFRTNRELAQLVERHPYKVDVVGSNPAFPTNNHRISRWFFYLWVPQLVENHIKLVEW